MDLENQFDIERDTEFDIAEACVKEHFRLIAKSRAETYAEKLITDTNETSSIASYEFRNDDY